MGRFLVVATGGGGCSCLGVGGGQGASKHLAMHRAAAAAKNNAAQAVGSAEAEKPRLGDISSCRVRGGRQERVKRQVQKHRTRANADAMRMLPFSERRGRLPSSHPLRVSETCLE